MKFPALHTLCVMLLVAIWSPALAESTRIVGEHRGTVTLAGRSLAKDAAARKQILAIVSTILDKQERALIMIEGDMASVRNKDQYIDRSLALAREVGGFLSGALKTQPEIILACRPAQKGSKAQNRVKFSVLPPSFRADTRGEARSIKWVLVENGQNFEVTEYAAPPGSPRPGTTAEALYIEPPGRKTEPVRQEQPAPRAMSAPRQVQQRPVTEEARKAEDLVARTRARAAEKARKLERASRNLAPLPADYR